MSWGDELRRTGKRAKKEKKNRIKTKKKTNKTTATCFVCRWTRTLIKRPLYAASVRDRLTNKETDGPTDRYIGLSSASD